MARIVKVKLLNGISFPVTSLSYGNKPFVSDIDSHTNAEGKGSIILTIKRGAEVIKKRMYSSWYLTFIDAKGKEVTV